MISRLIGTKLLSHGTASLRTSRKCILSSAEYNLGKAEKVTKTVPLLIQPSRQRPSSFLRPADAGVCNLILYETAARFYLIGTNSSQQRFKVLKIDRSEPRELNISDDRVEYTENELSNLLNSLDQGNRGKNAHRVGPLGLNRKLSAFGLVGFVRFLEGFFMILITKRRKVATIGFHSVYKVEETEMVPLAPEAITVMSLLEQRYLKTFQTIDLSSNFYYSYSYDVTHTLQHNMVGGGGLEKSSIGEPAWRFVWNEFLVKTLTIGGVGMDWIIPIIHGYVCQSEIKVFCRCLLLTIVARRSNRYAGTRFLKRGSNSQGHVANEIEVEQILHDTTYRNGRFTSFVQLRGSVPGYWSQESSKMIAKPPITLNRSDPFAGSAGAHFGDLLGRYGSPICCLNLVKKREVRKHESLLTDELTGGIAYLNQFLQWEHHIRYMGFDMARANKRGVALDSLETIGNKLMKHVGFFCSFPELFCHLFRCDASYREVQQVPLDGDADLPSMRFQHGTIRINCVDCLDRTNTAAFVVGKCVLGQQVYAMGLADSPHLGFDTDAVRMLEDMFEDLGNVLALQYGGSQLVHRVESYRHHGWSTNSKDWMRTISRYYSNTFSDFDKQAAINLFLGIFTPKDKSSHLWELQTDYFLHHPWTLDPTKHSIPNGYCQWLSVEVATALPAPYEDVAQTEVHYVPYDSFGTFYKIHQLGTIKDAFTFLIPNTVDDYMPTTSTDASPFVSRNRGMVKSTTSLLDPGLSSSPSANLSDGAYGSELEGDSSDTDTEPKETRPKGIAGYPSVHTPSARTLKSQFKTFEEYYGVALHQPCSADRNLYQRFANTWKHATKLESNETPLSERVRSNSTHLVQRSAFSMDSSYEVTPPTVSKKSRELYTAYVNSDRKMRPHAGVADMEVYRKFVELF